MAKRRKARGPREEPLPRSDRDLGIHTARRVELAQLEIASANKADGSPYEPTPYGVLDDLLLELDLDYERYTFCDLGAGKGRVLCLAARWPWRAIVGVEFSAALHRIATEHLARFRATWQRCRNLSCVHADVVEWRPPPGPLVLYLFNPFGAAVLAQLLARFRAQPEPRELVFLYYMPVHERVLARDAALEWVAAREHWVIYRSRNTPQGAFAPT